MRVINRNYSDFYDTKTDIQFEKIEVRNPSDKNCGCFISAAIVDDETAELFEERSQFEVLSEAEFLELLSVPAVVPVAPAPTPSGDPVDDAAASLATSKSTATPVAAPSTPADTKTAAPTKTAPAPTPSGDPVA